MIYLSFGCAVDHDEDQLRSKGRLLLFQRVLREDMPTKFFLDLLKESDQDFVVRTGWEYRHDAPLYVPIPMVQVQNPVQREGVPFWDFLQASEFSLITTIQGYFTNEEVQVKRTLNNFQANWYSSETNSQFLLR